MLLRSLMRLHMASLLKTGASVAQIFWPTAGNIQAHYTEIYH